MYNDLMDTIGFVGRTDPEIADAMNLELARQRRNIELIASENIVSPAVMAAMGSMLTNKYAEGYPGKRYYGGCVDVDIVENIARDRACRLFGAEHANVQPHSGAQANLAVYFALLKPGDTVMGMNLAHGGHLTHGSPVNMSGTYYNFVPYGVNDEGLPSSGKWPTPAARTSWWTWPTSPAWWQAASTRTPCHTPTLSPPPPIRPSGGPGAA